MTASVTLTAYWETAAGVPATGLAAAPTLRARRLDTDALEVTDAAMTEVGDGVYKFVHTPAVDGIEYSYRADGDPTVTGQVPSTVRFQSGQADNKLREVWGARGADPAFPKTVTENTAKEDYTEVADGMTIDHVKVGAVTTSTRT
jgi:hypothetical protein